MVVALNSENFKQKLAGKEGCPVPPFALVDFFATWCGPCQMLAPVIEELAAEFDKEIPEKIFVGKLDIDASRDVAQSYNIMSVPTLVLFKNGKEVQRITGYRDKVELKNTILELLDV